ASLVFSGCQTTPSGNLPSSVVDQPAESGEAEVLVLSEGDDVRIAFPGAPTLDTTQRVRTDGRLTLSMVGAVMAAGMTPAELEKKLLDLFASELVSKEVTVTV